LFVKLEHGKSMRGCSAVKDQAKDANDADARLDQFIIRALNKIKKPSTAEEITELLNRELGPGDRPFDAKEVESWLRNHRRKAVPLYWLATRPRR
jgi:hypothetical protein